jgi:hypothetical protein
MTTEHPTTPTRKPIVRKLRLPLGAHARSCWPDPRLEPVAEDDPLPWALTCLRCGVLLGGERLLFCPDCQPFA